MKTKSQTEAIKFRKQNGEFSNSHNNVLTAKQHKIWNRRKKIKVLIATSAVIIGVGGGIGVGYGIWHTYTNDIIDKHYSVNEIENWQFQSNHKNEDFSNLNPDDQRIINFFKNNYKPINLLDSIVDYCKHLLDKPLLSKTTDADPTMTIKEAVHTDWTNALNVEFIRMTNPNEFDIYLFLSFNFVEKCWFGNIEIMPNSVLEIILHTKSTFATSITKAYYVANDDEDKEIWKGNNVKITNSTVDTSFYLDFIFSYNSEVSLDFSSYKKSWSNVPIIGFDNIRLPINQ